MYIQRWLTHRLQLSETILPITVLTGARQTGKSTLLAAEPMFSGYSYTTLDDPDSREKAHRNPSAFVDTADKLIIDEAHREPDLFLAVKEALRKDKTRRFVLSGSANFLLLKRIQDSLAGRAAYHVLRQPLWTEWLRQPEPNWLLDMFDARLPVSGSELPPVPDLRGVLFRGFLPGIRDASCEQAAIFWQSYVTTYLERDLPDISPTSSLIDYRAVMRRVAMTTGSLLEFRKIADDTHVNERTVARYIDAIQKAYLLSLLPPAPLTSTTSVRRQWKPYPCDTGLICSLLGLKTPEALGDTFCGHLFEDMVFMTLQALCDLWDMGMHFVHTRRTAELHEVDFVLERSGKSVAIEAKMSDGVTMNDAAHVQWLMDNDPTCVSGMVVYGGSVIKNLTRHIVAVPWTML
jgi:predicted AAA+ superfamily ATPase